MSLETSHFLHYICIKRMFIYLNNVACHKKKLCLSLTMNLSMLLDNLLLSTWYWVSLIYLVSSIENHKTSWQGWSCYFELSYKWPLWLTLIAYCSVHGCFLKLMREKNRIVTTSEVSCFPFVLGSCFCKNVMIFDKWVPSAKPIA